MNTIYKYPIKITDSQEITVPWAASFLFVGLDPNGRPCIWAEVNSEEVKTQIWKVYIFGTGNRKPEEIDCYLGTIVQGMFVWHVYIES